MVAVAVIAAGLVILGTNRGRARNPFRKTDQPVEQRTWVGYSESALRSTLGAPTQVVQGYRQVGLTPVPTPPGPYRTLVYEHPDGYLYIWLSKQGADHVCSDSLWFNRDVQF